jgi:hypothetical protein
MERYVGQGLQPIQKSNKIAVGLRILWCCTIDRGLMHNL